MFRDRSREADKQKGVVSDVFLVGVDGRVLAHVEMGSIKVGEELELGSFLAALQDLSKEALGGEIGEMVIGPVGNAMKWLYRSVSDARGIIVRICVVAPENVKAKSIERVFEKIALVVRDLSVMEIERQPLEERVAQILREK
jgi:hypothetical protein